MAQFNATNFDTYRQYLSKMRDKAQDPQLQAYQSVVFSFLAIALFGWFAIRPTIQTIIQLRREIKDKEVISSTMTDKIAALIDAEGQYQAALPQLPLIDEAIPKSPEVVGLVDQVLKLIQSSSATASGVNVAKVPLSDGSNPQLATNKSRLEKAKQLEKKDKSDSGTVAPINTSIKNSLSKISLSVTITGAYQNLETVLERLYNLRRIVTVQSASFTVPTSQNEASIKIKPGDLLLDVKLESYYLEK